MLAFFGQKWRVNNLATYKSIIWSHFCQFLRGHVVRLLTYNSSIFVVWALLFFSKMSFSLQKKKNIYGKHKILKQRQWNKGGQVIDLWWLGYWPYSIHICIHIYFCKYYQIHVEFLENVLLSHRFDLFGQKVLKQRQKVSNHMMSLVTCSLCHLSFVKEFPRFDRLISTKIG